MHHAFSLPLLHDYNMKLSNLMFCRGWEQKTTTFFFYSWTLMQSFIFQKNLPTFDELTRWNKQDKVWGSANSLFKWRFRSCHHRRCVNSLVPNVEHSSLICPIHQHYLWWVKNKINKNKFTSQEFKTLNITSNHTHAGYIFGKINCSTIF